MARRLSPVWTAQMIEQLDSGEPIDLTLSFNPAAQWLITKLSRADRPFRVYQLGAGVKRITTVTDRCPLCRRMLVEEG